MVSGRRSSSKIIMSGRRLYSWNVYKDVSQGGTLRTPPPPCWSVRTQRFESCSISSRFRTSIREVCSRGINTSDARSPKWKLVSQLVSTEYRILNNRSACRVPFQVSISFSQAAVYVEHPKEKGCLLRSVPLGYLLLVVPLRNAKKVETHELFW